MQVLKNYLLRMREVGHSKNGLFFLSRAVLLLLVVEVGIRFPMNLCIQYSKACLARWMTGSVIKRGHESFMNGAFFCEVPLCCMPWIQTTNIGTVAQPFLFGALDPHRGGFRGGGLGGQDSPFWGNQKLQKEGKNVTSVGANMPRFST